LDSAKALVRIFAMCRDLPDELKRHLGAAMRVLRGGGLVAYPTDTVYGLGTDAFRPEAVARLYEVKHRPRYMPLPLLIADLEQLDRVADSLSPVVRRLAQRLWPGAVTLVVRKSAAVPDIVTAGSDKVGVRLPQHPIQIGRASCRERV